MITLRKKTHQKIAIGFIALICIMQISVPLYQAKAIIVEDPGAIAAIVAADASIVAAGSANVSAIEAAETARKFDAIAARTRLEAADAAQLAEREARDAQSFLERYVIYPAIRVLIMTLIQTITDETVGWISGDGGRNVGFVKNLEQNAYVEANAQAGEFLNHVSGINLCSVNIGKIIKLAINLPGYQHLNTQLRCSLTGIIDNVDRFYRDFNQGGWPAFVAIAADSKNNAIGASMIAQVNFQAKKGSAAQALQDRLNRGSGFKGVTLKKKSLVCDTTSKTFEGSAMEAGHCYTQEVDTTPGGVVADALNTSLNHAGLNMATAELGAISNAVDGAISAIITAVMQRLFKEARNLF